MGSKFPPAGGAVKAGATEGSVVASASSNPTSRAQCGHVLCEELLRQSPRSEPDKPIAISLASRDRREAAVLGVEHALLLEPSADCASRLDTSPRNAVPTKRLNELGIPLRRPVGLTAQELPLAGALIEIFHRFDLIYR